MIQQSGQDKIIIINFSGSLKLISKQAEISPGPEPGIKIYDNFSSPVTVAVDSGSNGLNGTYFNIGLGGSNGGYFTNSFINYVDIYSSGLNTLFNGGEHTLICRSKINANILNTTLIGRMIELYVDGSNRTYIEKRSSVNTMQTSYRSNAVIKSQNIPVSDTNWHTYAMTVSQTADEVRHFLDGVQNGGTDTGLGVWSGNLTTNRCNFGVETQTGGRSWVGSLSDGIISLNGTVATPAQVLTIHTGLDGGTLTPGDLDTIFGAGNWVWWKLDEQHQSLDTGPLAEPLTQYFHNGLSPRILTNNMHIIPDSKLELDSGNLTIGKWYEITATEVDHFYTGSLVGDTFRARAATTLDANNKVQELSIDSLISLFDYDQSNSQVDILPTGTDRTQFGIKIRSSSLSNLDIASYIDVYYDRIDGQIKIDEVISGTVSNLFNQAVTYSAGAKLSVIASGINVEVLYNEVSIVNQTVSLTTGNILGAFATHTDTNWSEISVYSL